MLKIITRLGYVLSRQNIGPLWLFKRLETSLHRATQILILTNLGLIPKSWDDTFEV